MIVHMSIENFNHINVQALKKILKNKKATAQELREALEIAILNSEQLESQLDLEYDEDDLAEIADIASAAWEQNSVTKVLCGLNLFATGALILLHIFL